jgi:sodium transport system ATP-binding protein
VIEVIDLSKTYRSKKITIQALNQLSFTANDGEITALLGPNGAGKTTFLRILVGLEQANAGSIYVDNIKSDQQTARIAYLSEGCGLYARLTAYENIAYFGKLHNLDNQLILNRIALLSEALNLTALLHRKVSGFSLGERMRVAIARAMIHDPHTIVLDEPTNGLDLASTQKLRQYLKYLTTEQGGKKCILFSSHLMHEVEKLADKVVILTEGSVKMIGSVNQIMSQTQCADFEDAFMKVAFAS